MPGKLCAHQDGFNLIEVMMATTILLVGFIGLIQAVTLGSESLDTARKQLVANQIVAAEIENLRGGDWSTIANLPATASVTVDPAGGISGDTTRFALGKVADAAADDLADLRAQARGFTFAFSRTRLRPALATASTATYVKLVYTVTWTGNTGRAHRHSVETYLSKNGLHLSFQQS